MGTLPRWLARAVCVLLGATAALGCVRAGEAVAATSPSPTTHAAASPTPAPTAGTLPSAVTLDLETDGSHATDAGVTLIATLKPATAWGDVALFDGTNKVASGDNYRLTWSYHTDQMTAGTHHLTVQFRPAATTGFAPSQAAVDYVVTTPTLAAPAPTAHKTKDPQPIVVTVPSVSVLATSTSRPSPTPSASASVKASSTTRASSGGSGGLPFTGFDVVGAMTAAGTLIGLGFMLLGAGRRRRRAR